MATAEAEPTAPPARKERDFGKIAHDLLAHPLVLLCAGALVTGIIVPSITSSWQRHQTAQDMKTQVIQDVTNAVSAPMAQMAVSENPVFAGSRPSAATIATTYNTFMTMKSSVHASLAAYFPMNSIPTQWDTLSTLVNHFYLLTYAPNGNVRRNNMAAIQRYLRSQHINSKVDWQVLATGNPSAPGYYTAWLAIKGDIQSVMDRLNASIMDAPAPSF